MLENRFGLIIDEEERVIIETSADNHTFKAVVEIVKGFGTNYNTDMVKNILQELGHGAEYLDNSTNENFHF